MLPSNKTNNKKFISSSHASSQSEGIQKSYKLLMVSLLPNENGKVSPMTSMIDSIAKSKYFYNVDETSLEIAKDILEKGTAMKSFNSGLNSTNKGLEENKITNILKKVLLDNLRISNSKKMFEVIPANPNYTHNNQPIKKKGPKPIELIFDQTILKSQITNFKNSICKEISNRNKLTPGSEYKELGILNRSIPKFGTSYDDSILENFKRKLKKITTLEQAEKVLQDYTFSTGYDLMDGFFKGDLQTLTSKTERNRKNSNPQCPTGPFGTSQKISLGLLMDTFAKSMKLNTILYGKLENVKTVYRGMGAKGFLKCIGEDPNKFFGSNSPKSNFILKKLLAHINSKNGKIVFQSNKPTSTSLSENVAKNYADAAPSFPVIMKIDLINGTAFGKDISKMSFGEKNEEVILKINQKIKIKEASIENNKYLIVECETIH